MGTSPRRAGGTGLLRICSSWKDEAEQGVKAPLGRSAETEKDRPIQQLELGRKSLENADC